MAEEQRSVGNNREPHFYRKSDGGYVRPILNRDGLEKLAVAIPAVGDGTGRWYGLALVLLEYVFGFKWIEQHILDEPKGSFFARSLETKSGHSVVMHRVRDLAELVVNLMPIRGVEACLDQIANGQIESGYSELEAGKLLLTRNIDFRFIWPSGVKGESFDLEVVFPNGKVVCADVKCKIETESFSKNGLFNSLEGARKRNLPKGFPGMVIVKIPQHWHESPAIMDDVAAACDKFLRGTKRIVCVQIYSSMIEIRNNIIHDWLKGSEIRNNFHDYDTLLNWRLLTNDADPAPNPKGWIRLASFYET